MRSGLINDLTELARRKDNFGILSSYLLNNLDNLPNINIQKIQDELFISISTPTRLAKKLKVSGFKELKYNLIQENEQLKCSDNLKNNVNLKEYMDSINEILSECININNDENILSIAKEINKTNEVYIFSKAENNLISQDFAIKLRRLGKSVFFDKDDGLQYINYKNIKKDSVVIFISYSSKVEIFKEISKSLQKINQNVIVITKENNRLIDGNYYINLSSKDNEYATYRSSSRLEIIVLLNFIIDLIIQLDYETNIQKLDESKYRN